MMQQSNKIVENIFFVARDSFSGKEEFYEVHQRDIFKITPHFQQVETALIHIEDLVVFFGDLVNKNKAANQNGDTGEFPNPLQQGMGPVPQYPGMPDHGIRNGPYGNNLSNNNQSNAMPYPVPIPENLQNLANNSSVNNLSVGNEPSENTTSQGDQQHQAQQQEKRESTQDIPQENQDQAMAEQLETKVEIKKEEDASTSENPTIIDQISNESNEQRDQNTNSQDSQSDQSDSEQEIVPQESAPQHNEEKSEENKLSPSIYCPQCDFKSSIENPKEMEQHLKQVHFKNEECFPCPQPDCSFTTKFKGNFQQHIKSVHKGIKEFSCSEKGCTLQFSLKGNLKQHLKVVHKVIMPYLCTECSYETIEKSEIKEHRRVNHNKKVRSGVLQKSPVKNFGQEINNNPMAQNNPIISSQMVPNETRNPVLGIPNDIRNTVPMMQNESRNTNPMFQNDPRNSNPMIPNLSRPGQPMTSFPMNQFPAQQMHQPNMQNPNPPTSFGNTTYPSTMPGFYNPQTASEKTSLELFSSLASNPQMFHSTESKDGTLQFHNKVPHPGIDNNNINQQQIPQQHPMSNSQTNTMNIQRPQLDSNNNNNINMPMMNQGLPPQMTKPNEGSTSAALPDAMNIDFNKLDDHSKCMFCQKEFDQKHRLKLHIKAVHQKIREFFCQEEGCTYEAAQKTNLKQHIKSVHLKIKEYSCSQCEYQGSQRVMVKKHMGSVHGSEDFEVIQNAIPDSPMKRLEKKKFDNFNNPPPRSNLQDRNKEEQIPVASIPEPVPMPVENTNVPSMVIENTDDSNQNDDPKRFACNIDQCNYKTTQNFCLKQHIKAMHEKIREWSCSKCDYQAAQKINCQNHLKRKHGIPIEESSSMMIHTKSPGTPKKLGRPRTADQKDGPKPFQPGYNMDNIGQHPWMNNNNQNLYPAGSIMNQPSMGQMMNQPPRGPIMNQLPPGHMMNQQFPGPMMNRPPTGPMMNHPQAGQMINNPPTGPMMNHAPPGPMMSYPPTGLMNQPPRGPMMNQQPGGPMNQPPRGPMMNQPPRGPMMNQPPMGHGMFQNMSFNGVPPGPFNQRVGEYEYDPKTETFTSIPHPQSNFPGGQVYNPMNESVNEFKQKLREEFESNDEPFRQPGEYQPPKLFPDQKQEDENKNMYSSDRNDPMELLNKMDFAGPPFNCPECNYTSTQVTNLRQHIKAVHHKIKDFSCTLCSYKSARKSTLTLHQKNRHPDAKELSNDKDINQAILENNDIVAQNREDGEGRQIEASKNEDVERPSKSSDDDSEDSESDDFQEDLKNSSIKSENSSPNTTEKSTALLSPPNITTSPKSETSVNIKEEIKEEVKEEMDMKPQENS